MALSARFRPPVSSFELEFSPRAEEAKCPKAGLKNENSQLVSGTTQLKWTAAAGEKSMIRVSPGRTQNAFGNRLPPSLPALFSKRCRKIRLKSAGKTVW
jgi:hypothetical protein